MLSDHNRQWCEGMSRLLAADAGFRPYLDLLLRAMQLSLENRRLVRSAAALPALEHVEVQRTQLSAPGPASRPPAPSKLAEKKMVQLWAWVVDILTAQGEPHAQLCPCVLLHLASYVHHSPPPLSCRTLASPASAPSQALVRTCALTLTLQCARSTTAVDSAPQPSGSLMPAGQRCVDAVEGGGGTYADCGDGTGSRSVCAGVGDGMGRRGGIGPVLGSLPMGALAAANPVVGSEACACQLQT